MWSLIYMITFFRVGVTDYIVTQIVCYDYFTAFKLPFDSFYPLTHHKRVDLRL